MNANLEPLVSPETVASQQNWTVISQVKSHRIVYFTDDENYSLTFEGDWYYVSPLQK